MPIVRGGLKLSDILQNCKGSKILSDISKTISSDPDFVSFIPANYLYEDGASKYYANETEVFGALAGIYEHKEWVRVPVCFIYKREESNFYKSKELIWDQSVKQCLFRFIHE